MWGERASAARARGALLHALTTTNPALFRSRRRNIDEEASLAARVAGAAFFAARFPREAYSMELRDGPGDGEVALAVDFGGAGFGDGVRLLERVRWSGAACSVGGAFEGGVGFGVGVSEDGSACVARNR